MRLRTRLNLVTLALGGVAFLLFALVSWRTLLRTFAAIEREVVAQSLQRLDGALQSALREIDTMVSDWAWWDDTYQFMVDTNAAYAAGNLTPEALATLRVDWLAFFDPSGRLVCGVGRDRASNTLAPLPERLVAGLRAEGLPGRVRRENEYLRGIWLCEGSPQLVVARPILTSACKGPPRGTLIMARALDAAEVERLGELVGLPMRLQVLQRQAGARDFEGGFRVKPLDRQRIAGFWVWRDVCGRPAVQAVLEQSRTIYAQARRSLVVFLATLALVWSVTVLALHAAVGGFVLDPLSDLQQSVASLRAEGPALGRVAAAGPPEIVALAESVNRTLEALEHAQAERLKAETRVRELLERVPDVVYTVTSEGVITSLNPAFERLTGWSREEWIGRTFEELVHPEDLPKAFDTLNAALRGETPPPYELRVRAKSGEYLVGEFTTAPWIEDGKIVGEQGIVRDVTLRRREEQERETLRRESDRARRALLSILEDQRRVMQQLRQSEARFREMAALMPETVFEVDLEGRISFVNEFAYQLWGYSPEEFARGVSVFDIIVPEQHALLRENIRARLEGKKGGHAYLARRKDGTVFPVEVYSTPILREGRAVGLRGVIIDVSERMELQKLQVAKEAAEAASRAKSEFLAKMSHELRTPLNVVIGYAEALEDELYGPLQPKQKESVQHILSSSQYLLQLLNDLLELSRAEAGRLELQRAEVPIARLMEESLIAIQDRVRRMKLQVTLNIPPEVRTLRLAVDERRVRQILFNLLTNAAKFSREGGRITLSARIARSPERPPELEIAVADTGIGLAPEHLQRVFEKFYQVPRPEVSAQEGTGLGLALAQEFVHLHGGRIWAESPGEGKGSTFFFTLPLESAG